MKPEQLVPTLETCKKLKEVGVEWVSEPLFYAWIVKKDNKPVYTLSSCLDCGTEQYYKDSDTEWYYTPTVAELMEVLPYHIWERGNLTVVKYDERDYSAKYDDEFGASYTNKSSNPAEALALLYIELKEKGII